MFNFSTYRPNLIEHLLTHKSDCMRDLTAVITASVIETTHRPGLYHQQHFLIHKQTSYIKHVLLVL